MYRYTCIYVFMQSYVKLVLQTAKGPDATHQPTHCIPHTYNTLLDTLIVAQCGTQKRYPGRCATSRQGPIDVRITALGQPSMHACHSTTFFVSSGRVFPHCSAAGDTRCVLCRLSVHKLGRTMPWHPADGIASPPSRCPTGYCFHRLLPQATSTVGYFHRLLPQYR